MSIEVVGEERVIATCVGVGERAQNLSPEFTEEIGRLERAEESVFSGGEYVRTGALRDSLTHSGAEGAVRRVTRSSLEFGSSIFYARFQVENPGPQTPAGGLERKGHPSAVLKLEPQAGVEVTESVGEYILRGPLGMLL